MAHKVRSEHLASEDGVHLFLGFTGEMTHAARPLAIYFSFSQSPRDAEGAPDDSCISMRLPHRDVSCCLAVSPFNCTQALQ